MTTLTKQKLWQNACDAVVADVEAVRVRLFFMKKPKCYPGLKARIEITEDGYMIELDQ